ncbi:MAG: heme-binding protein [Acetobacteraceae bacterium]|nr:heme-binding protein [Acetobacteraceae bacterium]
MSALSLDQARTIITAALGHAHTHNFQKLAIAVLDARGALKAFGAEDGTSLKRGEIAQGKAHGALAMGMGSRTLFNRAQQQPFFIAAVTHAVGGALIPVPGGVLIKDATGIVLGAVGISGDNSDNDEAAALAGIAATGLMADPGA